MRKGREFDFEKGNADLIFDWKVSPDEVMKDLHTLLKRRFRIEITTHETHGDFYAFSVRKFPKKK